MPIRCARRSAISRPDLAGERRHPLRHPPQSPARWPDSDEEGEWNYYSVHLACVCVSAGRFYLDTQCGHIAKAWRVQEMAAFLVDKFLPGHPPRGQSSESSNKSKPDKKASHPKY